MTAPMSAARAAWLLTRLRLRRQLNQIGSAYRWRKASPTRTATGRKASAGWLLTAFVMLAMLGSFTNLAYQSVANMEKVLGSVQVSQEVRRGWLGVQIGQVTAEMADRLSLKSARGVLITGIIDGGPAKPALRSQRF